MWVVGTSSAVNPLKLINGCTSVNNCFVGVAIVVASEVSFNYRRRYLLKTVEWDGNL